MTTIINVFSLAFLRIWFVVVVIRVVSNVSKTFVVVAYVVIVYIVNVVYDDIILSLLLHLY